MVFSRNFRRVAERFVCELREPDCRDLSGICRVSKVAVIEVGLEVEATSAWTATFLRW